MDLIIDEMMQFEEVCAADHDAVLERFTRTAVIKNCLAIDWQSGSFDCAEYFFVARAIEDRRSDVETCDIRFRHAETVDIVAEVTQTLLNRRIMLLDLFADLKNSTAKVCL